MLLQFSSLLNLQHLLCWVILISMETFLPPTKHSLLTWAPFQLSLNFFPSIWWKAPWKNDLVTLFSHFLLITLQSDFTTSTSLNNVSSVFILFQLVRCLCHSVSLTLPGTLLCTWLLDMLLSWHSWVLSIISDYYFHRKLVWSQAPCLDFVFFQYSHFSLVVFDSIYILANKCYSQISISNQDVSIALQTISYNCYSSSSNSCLPGI